VAQAGGRPRSRGCRNNSWSTWVENPKPPGPFLPLRPPQVLPGTRRDAGESRPGGEGLGGCSAPGLSLLPPPLPLPPLGRCGWSSVGGNRSFCGGEGGSCIKMSPLRMWKLLVLGWHFWAEVSVFSSLTIPSLHGGAELQGPAELGPGQQQSPPEQAGSELGSCSQTSRRARAQRLCLPAMPLEVAAPGPVLHSLQSPRSERHWGCRSTIAQPVS